MTVMTTKERHSDMQVRRGGGTRRSARRAQASAFLLIILLIAFAGGALYAQVLTGEIDGTVRDTSGAVVPNATVTVRNANENVVQRTARTNGQGYFTAPLLAVGRYSLAVDAPGFKTSVIDGVEVHIGVPISVQVSLAPGAVSQRVTVTANSVAPELTNSSAGTLINSRQMVQLPLSSRDYLQMMYLQPGISGPEPGPDNRGNISSNGSVNTQTFSVNGLPTNANGYFVDGEDINKRLGQQPIAFPGVDFIQEMNLQRANYGAEYGGAGGAFVSVQTKAGATAFHGGAYEYYRSQIFDANGYFNNLAALPRPELRYYDFGYELGGPVWIPHLTDRHHSKTFFFFGQEYLRSENSINQNVTDIPTAAQRQGNFGVPVCIAYNSAGKCSKTATSITQFDPTAQEYLKDIVDKVPLPNNPNDPQGVIAYSPGVHNGTQTIIRIDHQFNQRLSGFFRYLNDPYQLVAPNGFQSTSSIPGVATSDMTSGSTDWLGNVTYVVNPKSVLNGGFAVLQNWVTSRAAGLMAKTNAPDVNPSLPYINVLDNVPHLKIYSSTYAVTGPYDERFSNMQIFLNDTSTIGRHTLQFGFNLEYQNAGGDNGSANAGTFTFAPNALPAGGATDFDQAFAEFLQGSVSTFTQDSQNLASSVRTNLYEAYVQDDFHPTSRLTLDAGVRYSYFASASPARLPGFPTLYPIVNFDPNTFNTTQEPAIGSTGLICTTAPCPGGKLPNPTYNPRNGLILAGVNSPYGDKITTQPYLDFAPRLGFAYDVFGNGRLAIRGGFGVYYLPYPTTKYKSMINTNYPNEITATISNTSFGNPGNGVPQFSSAPAPIAAVALSEPEPYAEAFNLDVQRQITRNSVLDIGYYANVGRHQIATFEANQPAPGAYVQAGIIPGNVVTKANSQFLNQIRPYPGYESIGSDNPWFSSNYNSLQVSYTERVRNGAILAANYTYSKALNNVRTPQNIYNLQSEYGPDAQDRTNIFNADFVYPLPFYREQHGLSGHALGGWEIAGAAFYGSGQYSTATTIDVDPGGVGVLTGAANGRPDYVSNPNHGAPHTVAQWFNTAAFQQVPAGQYRPGDDGVQNILGPGYEDWDLSVHKNVRFGQSLNLQLRAEAYNAFNHVNFANVATTLAQTNYGEVTSAGPARTMQMAVRLNF